MKHSVHIDVDEVVQIFEVGTGYGVDGFIGVGHRIQKGIERSLEQFIKGAFDGKMFRTTQHRVFEDVGHTVGIGGQCAKRNAEAFVFVVVMDRYELRPTWMAINAHRGVDIADFFEMRQHKLM